MKEKVAISWSGGKDCTLALYDIIQSKQFEIHSLHTSFNHDTGRVGLHGIKQKLIEQQASSIGVPLDKIFILSSEDHEAYEDSMRKYYQDLAHREIKKIVFGDIFLADLKLYREKMLAQCGIEGIFPLWKTESRQLAEKFIKSGFKALICAADSKLFEPTSLGRNYDLDFINSLNDDVDPCGENGEFHTYVYDGPIFKNPVHVRQLQVESKEYKFKVQAPDGRVEERTNKFWFQELDY